MHRFCTIYFWDMHRFCTIYSYSQIGWAITTTITETSPSGTGFGFLKGSCCSTNYIELVLAVH